MLGKGVWILFCRRWGVVVGLGVGVDVDKVVIGKVIR